MLKYQYIMRKVNFFFFIIKLNPRFIDGEYKKVKEMFTISFFENIEWNRHKNKCKRQLITLRVVDMRV